MFSLDRLDAALLGELTRNPRAGIVDLSAKLGVARNTVQSRIRKLEESGAVTGYRPVVDLPKLGVPLQAFIGAELVQAQMGHVIAQLGRFPEVLEVHATTGREDLLIRMAAQSQEDLLLVLERLHAIEGVAHTTTTLALTTPIEYRTQPLVEHITRDAGHGRSSSPGQS
ncbi:MULTISPECIES: Lrp/AsnC family transcriptional regulator [Rhodococcus]|uniref:DNA-binding Lrp family transcriptional regulator n=1 Tax=Rhodococcus rhodochrous J45 TaxID=935266 RepID=A0A562E0X4_RHORH|nr:MULTISPECIES: Lrp/AsnC family transcriptional regulator [Rhodococcus]TWH15609.1 DNA-binding Lrp family transcriptional regulator [Rhodococcus rhodochrous J45]